MSISSTRKLLGAAALLAVLGACASSAPQAVADAAGAAQPVAADTADTADTAADADAAEPAAEPGADAPDRARAASRAAVMRPEGFELGVWREPSFKRWFLYSYVAETEVEPRVTLIEREILEEVYEQFGENDLDEAREILEGMRGPTASATVDFMLGNVYMQQDRLEEAVASYTLAAGKFPNFRRAWKLLAVARVQLEDFPGAIEAFTEALRLGANDGITYGLLGVAYVNTGNDLAAESALRQANLLDADTRDWQLWLARSLFRQQRFADAVALCDTLIGDDPGDPTLWLMQANAYIGLKQPLRAAENYELVDQLGGSTVASLNSLGDIYFNEEIYDLAVDSYARAMQLDDEGRVDRPLQAAMLMTSRNALDETRRLLAHIEALHGDDLEPDDLKSVLRLKAQIALAEGAGDEEARVLEQVVALDPLDGRALIQLGEHAARGGDVERAVFYYERAASLEAFEADAKVLHAQLLVGEGRFQEAVPMLRRAQELDPRENVQQFLEQVERRAKS